MKYRIRPFLFFLVLSFLFITPANAQEMQYTFHVGNALGTTGFLKKQMFNTEGLIGYEMSLTKEFSLSFSLGSSRIRVDYYDTLWNQVYNPRIFITVPVKIKKYISGGNKKKLFFFELGLAGNYCFLDKRESRYFVNTTIIQKKYFTGFNIAVLGGCGLKSYLTPVSSIAFSMQAQSDFLTHYSTDLNKIKFVKSFFSITYAVKMGKK